MKRTRWVNSVFDMASPPSGRRWAPPVDLDAIPVRMDVERPAPPRRPSGKYSQMLARMPVGGCFELPPKCADSLVSQAKRSGVKVSRRTLEDGRVGVWRLS